MRLPRMKIRHWMILNVVAALDFALIVQRISQPVSYVAFVGTIAVVLLSSAMLLLLMLAADN
jgi:hypothetical protein